MADPQPTYETLQTELAEARAELRALRWLLPAARLLRGAPGKQAAPLPIPAAAETAAELPAPPPRAGVRGVAMAAYRVARPLVRPVAWRSRTFLTGHVMAELQDLRAKLDLVLERTERGAGGRGALDPAVATAAERALLTLALESRQG